MEDGISAEAEAAGEIEVTPEMIASLLEYEVIGDSSEERLETATTFFAAIFFAQLESIPGEIRSIRAGGRKWNLGGD